MPLSELTSLDGADRPPSQGADGRQVRILLADDHDLVRETLKFYLEKLDPRTEVIEAGSFGEALELANRSGPLDLIILDLKMPGMNRFAGLETMRSRFPRVPTVILSGVLDRDDVLAALQCGAAGVIPKTLSAQRMLSAMRLVLSGERYLPSMMMSSETRGEATFATAREAFAPGSPLDTLTRREREVLGLLTAGLTNRAIADRLGIREVTVKLHLRGVFRKLGARNRTQAMKIALELGWKV